MANYKEQTVQGESWQRCYSITIDNPLNETPVATFREETVVKVGNNTLKQPVTACTLIFNSAETFEVVDPTTGISTGTSLTHEDLYKFIYSLYIKTAKARDENTQTIVS